MICTDRSPRSCQCNEWNYSLVLVWQSSEWGWSWRVGSWGWSWDVNPNFRWSNPYSCPGFSFCWDVSEDLLHYRKRKKPSSNLFLEWNFTPHNWTCIRRATKLNWRWHSFQYLVISYKKSAHWAPLVSFLRPRITSAMLAAVWREVKNWFGYFKQMMLFFLEVVAFGIDPAPDFSLVC